MNPYRVSTAESAPSTLRSALRLHPSIWLGRETRIRVTLAVLLLIGACLVGAAVPLVPAKLLLAGVIASGIIVAVAMHPPLAAYLVLGVTPLVAGIDRGRVIPVLRPNEALSLLAATGLFVRWFFRLRSGTVPRLSLSRTDRSIVVLAVASSVLPILWMLLRGQRIEQDDVLYALLVWKYYAVFLIVRASRRSDEDIYRCLWISLFSAAIVAIIAILQSLQIGGITHALAKYYAPYGSVQALDNSRGGSTLAMPIAVADLMTFNLGILAGLLVRYRSNRRLLFALGALFVAGVMSSGEFSGVIGLVIGAVTVAIIIRRVRPLVGLVAAILGASFLLRPVVERRLAGFQSASGLPSSWVQRLHNLQSYFWPTLFSHGNFILGVRPAARVATATMATGYIWIESGYTWLLWAGGLPLLAAFFYFVWVNLRQNFDLASARRDSIGAAATGVTVGLVVIAFMMILDSHLTYRGSADLLFALLGLTAIAVPRATVPPATVPRATGGERLPPEDALITQATGRSIAVSAESTSPGDASIHSP